MHASDSGAIGAGRGDWVPKLHESESQCTVQQEGSCILSAAPPPLPLARSRPMASIQPRRITIKGGSSLLLRTALPEDAEAVVAHLRRMSADAPWILRTPEECDFPLEEERRLLNDWLFHESAIALIAERDAEAPGGRPEVKAMAIFMTASRRKIAHTVEVGMGADPDMRGMGIGRVMLEALLDFAVTCPVITKVMLKVYPANVYAHRLYSAVGFVEEARIQRSALETDGTYHDMIQMAMYVKPGIAPEGYPTWPLS
ncbi:MAG: GNAT family N-acetyltransferase [Phycisphaerae bacterium]|nr:GNAT family N-acetyltransferase [Phycisphaerae bacterium]